MSDYTLLRARDAPDWTGGKAPGHRFYGYGGLGSDQLSMNVIVLEPGTTHTVPGMDENIGHSHDDIDEVYVVVSGEVTVKIDDDELTLGPLDAVRIAPAAKRATRNTSDTEVTIVMFSQKMHDPRAQSHFHDGFWPAR